MKQVRTHKGWNVQLHGYGPIGFRPAPPTTLLANGSFDALRFMCEESGHELEFELAFVPQIDAREIRAYCDACHRQWSYTVSGAALARAYDATDIMREAVRVLVRRILADPCRSLEEIQLLAERITELLAAAGAEGLPYLEVVRGVVADHEAPGGDIARVIEEMGLGMSYADGTTRLHLPEGHIQRTW